MRTLLSMVACCLILSAWGCRDVGSSVDKDGTTNPSSVVSIEANLLEIAATYEEKFPRVNRISRWVVTDCAAPGPRPEMRISRSTDSPTHGRKLYALFAKQAWMDDDLGVKNYTKNSEPSPVGQVIVKESWLPEEIKDEKREEQIRQRHPEAQKHPDRFVRDNGRLYYAAGRADLFIMFKTDPCTPGTDNGWAYGTVSADRKTLTSSGRVESCMKCHQKAPHDRLFGLPKD